MDRAALPEIPFPATVDSLAAVLRRAGWPLRPVVERLPRLDSALAGPVGALDLLPGAPVPLVWASGDAAAAGRLALRLARQAPGRSAVVLGSESGRLRCQVVGLVARGVRAWVAPTGPLRTVDLEVWSTLLDARAPSVAAMQLGTLMERRDVDARFFADVRRWRDRMNESWVGVPCGGQEAMSMVTLARLVFLAFVQRKGWLGGDREFLPRLLLEPGAEALYRGRLAPLFFDALNRPVSERSSGPRFAGVPFLNGGLFEPTELERACPDLSLPDDVIREGVERVLVGYRFVEDERRIDGAAIDPRMLGRVFEGLMSPDRRERTGTFYTPPALVDAVVGDAFRTHLLATLPAEVVEALCRGEAVSPGVRPAAASALRRVRVLDPASGSGAFLLGALDWLSRAWRAVGDDAEADVRRRVMSECLHGIDVSPTAILLCELRLWLSLCSSLPDDVVPPPLPNLHHRLRVGNALLSASAYATARSARARELGSSLEQLHRQLGGATGTAKRALDRERRRLERALARAVLADETERVRARLHTLRAEPGRLFDGPEPRATELRRARSTVAAHLEELLAESTVAGSESWAPGFDPQVQFGSVMSEGGFDVVVGNPPWVRLSSIARSDRERIRARYSWMRPARGRAFGAQPDLSVAFVERSLQLARRGGVVSLVVPSKLFSAQYGQALRRSLALEHSLRSINDLSARGEEPFGVDAYPSVLTVERAPPVGRRVHVNAATRFTVLPSELSLSADAGGGWPLVDPEEMQRMRVWMSTHPLLGEQVEVRMGIKTGCNRVFVNPPSGVGPTVPALRGRDLGGTAAATAPRVLFAYDTRTGRSLQHVDKKTMEYLEEHQSVLSSRTDLRGNDPLWALFRVYPSSLGHRVVWRDIAESLVAKYVPPVWEGGPLALNTVYYASVPSAAAGQRLATWLNSPSIRRLAWCLAEPALNGYRRFQGCTVKQLPVPSDLFSCREETEMDRDRHLMVRGTEGERS